MTVCSYKNCFYYRTAKPINAPNTDLRECKCGGWIDENGKCLTFKEIPEKIEKLPSMECNQRYFPVNEIKRNRDKLNELIDVVNELWGS